MKDNKYLEEFKIDLVKQYLQGKQKKDQIHGDRAAGNGSICAAFILQRKDRSGAGNSRNGGSRDGAGRKRTGCGKSFRIDGDCGIARSFRIGENLWIGPGGNKFRCDDIQWDSI